MLGPLCGNTKDQVHDAVQVTGSEKTDQKMFLKC